MSTYGERRLTFLEIALSNTRICENYEEVSKPIWSLRVNGVELAIRFERSRYWRKPAMISSSYVLWRTPWFFLEFSTDERFLTEENVSGDYPTSGKSSRAWKA